MKAFACLLKLNATLKILTDKEKSFSASHSPAFNGFIKIECQKKLKLIQGRPIKFQLVNFFITINKQQHVCDQTLILIALIKYLCKSAQQYLQNNTGLNESSVQCQKSTESLRHYLQQLTASMSSETIEFQDKLKILITPNTSVKLHKKFYKTHTFSNYLK